MHTTDDTDPIPQPEAPNMRSFSMHSQEGYEALCTPRERPWIPNGSLPREPRCRDLPVIVERSGGKERRS